MTVRIRLRRMGRKKQPHYRVVVATSQAPRDGRFVENLGYYRPLSDPARLVLDLDRVDHWLAEGASPSATVKNLIDRARKGGDEKVAFGEPDAEARRQAEAEALARRRADEKARREEAEAEAKAEAEAAAAAEKAEEEGAEEGAEADEEGAEATAEAGDESEVRPNPQDQAEKPEGSAGSDESSAETRAQGEDRAVAQSEEEEPNAPPEESIARASAAESAEKTSKGKAAKKAGDETPESKRAAGSEPEGSTGGDADAAVQGPSEDEAPEVEVPAEEEKE